MTSAIINTKNNAFNANGKVVEVTYMGGDRVTCRVFIDELQKFISVEFTKDELIFN